MTKAEITTLRPEREPDYAALLQRAPQALFYHGLRYRAFLQELLHDARDHYLLAYEHGRLTAAFPAFLKHGPLGVVVNSLPFYGSHGSIVAAPEASAPALRALLQAFDDLCARHAAICSTIVANPLAADPGLFDGYPADYVDLRIGQFTPLPRAASAAQAEQALLEMLHPKTRNSVRKGARAGFATGHTGDAATLRALHALHQENIRRIGGLPKPWRVFAAIGRHFAYDRDYRVYVAREADGRLVSALLVFYFKAMVEYFTPATLESHRPFQPLSHLIFVAMRDAVVERGATCWNWGGTWPSQQGVYLFKSRWGTRDLPYHYYIREYPAKGRLRGIGREQLVPGYPFFYTIPFAPAGG